MVKEYIDIVLKLCSLAMIIAAAGMWAGAVVDTRPMFKDEQTWIGGTIWSQLIIPISLLLSKISNERMDPFIDGYFLLTGVGICVITGIILVLEEIKAMNTTLRSLETQLNPFIGNYDRMCLGIGILSLIAGALIFAQLLLLFLV